MYGLKSKRPINIQITILYYVQQYTTEEEEIEGRINQLVELDESRRVSLSQMARNQEEVKNTFDHKAKERDFTKGELVLLWDKRREKPGMHKKLDGLWIGPYNIMSQEGTNSFNLTTLEGEALKLPMNAIHIKRYFLPVAWQASIGKKLD